MERQSIQDRYSPKSICFGCGPANEDGLQIKSFEDGGELICEWMPQKHHQAAEGMLNGGIVGALLDCHSNWAAITHMMKSRNLETPPSTVTADYKVNFLKPTPTDGPVNLVARVLKLEGNRSVVEADLIANDIVCATCIGTFVEVKPDHPAYQRWEPQV
jgi:uncharacterized protein (TIGR00369 family)